MAQKMTTLKKAGAKKKPTKLHTHGSKTPSMKTIALIPCSATKRNSKTPLAAEELYTGPLFKKALECATAMKPDAVYILSAQHHLVKPETKLRNYNMLLSKQPAAYRRESADKVLEQLRDEGVDLGNDRIVFLTGKAYYANLVKHIKHVCIIGEGMPIGRKMSEFNRIIRKNNH